MQPENQNASVNVNYAQAGTITSYEPALLEIIGQRIQLTATNPNALPTIVFNFGASDISKITVSKNKMGFKTLNGI